MNAPIHALPADESLIFRGFVAEDLARLEALVVEQPPTPGLFTTAFGLRIDPACYGIVAHLAGQTARGVPFPDDGFIADGIEYAALALALERAPRSRPFTVCEAGAGFGPWSSLAAVLALRLGFPGVRLIALEASASRFATLRAHLALNGLAPADAPAIGEAGRVSWRLFEAAIDARDGTLFWPAADDVNDAGMRPLREADERRDYRGVEVAPAPVRAVSLETAFGGYDLVDFLHVDIQGAERELVPATLGVLRRRVRSMFVGTHSRKIEGDLLAMLRDEGWLLFREKPCQFYTTATAPTLEGLTYRDGGQYWWNPAID